MGSLSIDKMDLSRARQVFADIGFGGLTMTYSKEISFSSRVQTSIAAGYLFIQIPDDQIPVIITIHNSPLCHVDVPECYKKIKPDIFVSPGYDPDSDDLLDFDLNVGLGKIKFAIAE